ncbi:MAG: GGDEF domain-containing protein, partial [Proteobacteria bacterium]|nr:GGDEF domain-containing protein [Pseudomonadota bacterium]
ALRANTRVFDSVARYGGEEFAVVMPATDADSAAAAGERLRAAVEGLRFSADSGESFSLTVSVGTVCSGTAGCAAEALLAKADEALYDAKRRGRNRVVNLASA